MKNIFKNVSKLTVLGILAIVGIASAALLTTYVTTTGTADIEQAVVFTEKYHSHTGSETETSHVYDVNGAAGFIVEEKDEIENRSEMIAPVEFITDCTDNCGLGSPCGVKTSYWSTLELENKDSSWNVISDSTRATLIYELASNSFNYEFDATGLSASTDYSLIYYADKPDRFVNWGGNNPGALIATFTSDTKGDILATTGSKNLMMNLPHANDANNDEYDYCTLDGFDLCHGAKIWLVLSSDYSKPELTRWNPASYLFETDMITYDDTDTDSIALKMFTGKLDFFIRNDFPVGLSGGTYDITTSVNPVP